MANVTATQVKQIISTDLSDTIVEAYIDGAYELVNDVLGDDTTISSSLKAEIEKWLAAHMIAITRERVAKEEGAGGAYIKYTGVFTVGLLATPYGQVVKELDTTGKMAALGRKTVSVRAVEETDP
jgi:hypothetical protein